MTAGVALTAGCASPRVESAPTVEVRAVAETTAVATANADAADDPAIWAAAPGHTVLLAGQRVAGFVAGTDKKAGLYVYGLDGRELQFLPDGRLNNVDLREAVVDGRSQLVIGASDRSRGGIALYLFDPASTDPGNALRPWGLIPSDVVEPYGFCMGVMDEQPHAVLVAKDGEVRQYQILADGAEPIGKEVRRFAVGSQSEGCVVDEAGNALYVGEEAKGVWRYGFAPSSGAARASVQGVDSTGRLIADVEGITLLKDGAARYLLVSSQGDSAFAVWRVDQPEPTYAGRFRVVAGNGIDAVTGTDGIDARGGVVGPFPEGLVVVQDDENEGSQNFKLIDWRDIRRALGL